MSVEGAGAFDSGMAGLEEGNDPGEETPSFVVELATAVSAGRAA